MEKIEQVQEKLAQVVELANDFEDALDTLLDLKSAIMENLVECEDLVAQLYEEQEAKELPTPRKKYETVENFQLLERSTKLLKKGNKHIEKQ